MFEIIAVLFDGICSLDLPISIIILLALFSSDAFVFNTLSFVLLSIIG